MTPQDNEPNGGETQADASAEVKSHEQIVADAVAAEEAAKGEDATSEDASGDEGMPEKISEPTPETESEPEVAPESEAAPGAPVAETPEDEGEPDTQDEAEQPEASGVDEVARTNCIAVIEEMHDVTSRNHMKPNSWWDERLGALREFITTV